MMTHTSELVMTDVNIGIGAINVSRQYTPHIAELRPELLFAGQGFAQGFFCCTEHRLHCIKLSLVCIPLFHHVNHIHHGLGYLVDLIFIVIHHDVTWLI